MPFKETKEGSTHYENDGCGEPEHNKKDERFCEKHNEHSSFDEVIECNDCNFYLED